MVLIWISLMTNHFEYLFMYWPFVYLWRNVCLFRSLAHLKFKLSLIIYLLEFFLNLSGCVGLLLLCELFFSCRAQASHCDGFSWSLRASVVATRGFDSCSSWALEHRLSTVAHHLSCPTPRHVETSQARDQTVSLALADGLFTTEPSGKPTRVIYSGY